MGTSSISVSEVSTHSRPKAAGESIVLYCIKDFRFQHTAARRRLEPKPVMMGQQPKFQHTAARRRLVVPCSVPYFKSLFQHTAARRRLESVYSISISLCTVSTHSRPKAAGASLKSLAPSGFAAPISLSSQEKREREYNTAFSVTPAFAIS